ncbi:MAG: ADP-ribosylglycohydrolase family protein, partial [Mycobacteriales bacterium]
MAYCVVVASTTQSQSNRIAAAFLTALSASAAKANGMNTALGIAGIVWADRFDAAASATPDAFAHNGWVVEALQGAWSAISGTPVPAEDRAAGIFRGLHLRLALEAGVRGGRDTDTVAAIAGGLLGAAYGASAVPATWRRIVHGWPGLRARGLL